VISDLYMPRLNRARLLQQVGSELPQLPFILITGYTGSELQHLRVKPPSCKFLTKPLDWAVLLIGVQRCLRQHA
jgi:DNA-binding NtrC family response regulator